MMDNSDTDSDDKSCIVVPLSPENPKIHRRIGHVVVKYKNFIVVWGGYEVSEYYLISFEVEKVKMDISVQKIYYFYLKPYQTC